MWYGFSVLPKLMKMTIIWLYFYDRSEVGKCTVRVREELKFVRSKHVVGQ